MLPLLLFALALPLPEYRAFGRSATAESIRLWTFRVVLDDAHHPAVILLASSPASRVRCIIRTMMRRSNPPLVKDRAGDRPSAQTVGHADRTDDTLQDEGPRLVAQASPDLCSLPDLSTTG